MGLLACVKYLHYLTTKHNYRWKKFILIAADNIAAIQSPGQDLSSIRNTFIPDADIILEMKYWIKIVPLHIHFKHIRGHQDRNQSYSSLSPLAQLNIHMDKLAKSALLNLPPTPTGVSPFFLHSGVSITSPYGRITSHFKDYILQQYIGSNAEKQFMKTFHLSEADLKLIDWENFKKYMSRKKGYERFKIVKFIHHQWPVMMRNYQWKESSTPLCPLCIKTNETCDHIFHCKEIHMKMHRRSKLRSLKSDLYAL